MSKGMFNGNGRGRQWDFMCGPVGDPGGHKPIKTVMGMVYGIELGLPHEWEWMIPWEYDVIICEIYTYIYMVHIYGDKRNTRDDDG